MILGAHEFSTSLRGKRSRNKSEVLILSFDSTSNLYSSSPAIMTAREAFSSLSITPLIYSPKEVLGLVNGTSISASVASLAISTTHQLAYLSQVITAMNLEALLGCKDEFEEFIHDVARPHPGQIEVAKNVRRFMEGSKFIRGDNEDLGVVDLLVEIATGSVDQGEKFVENDEEGFFLKQDR